VGPKKKWVGGRDRENHKGEKVDAFVGLFLLVLVPLQSPIPKSTAETKKKMKTLGGQA